jgi:hypothetical protein
MATTRELIAALEEVEEGHDGPIEVMVQYQPNYPLRETVAPGVWNPHDKRDRTNLTRSFVCGGCDETIEGKNGALVQQTFDEDGVALCDECVEGYAAQEGNKHLTSDGRPIVYLVLTGAPYDINPYGDRAAFEDGEY